jgi:hypothetical protein
VPCIYSLLEDNFSSGMVSLYYFLFFWVDFSSGVFPYLFNGSLASRIFFVSNKGPSRNYKTSTIISFIITIA